MTRTTAARAASPAAPIHVCMIVPSYFPALVGGAETQCRRLCSSLSARGVRCTVLTPRQSFHHPATQYDGETRIIRTSPLHFLTCVVAKAGAAVGLNRVHRRDSPFELTPFLRLVQWFSALSFILGASAHLFRHRRTFSLLHVHIAGWMAGYAQWIGPRLNMPVLCKGSQMPVFLPFGHDIPFSNTWKWHRMKTHFVTPTSTMCEELFLQGVPAARLFVVPNGVAIPLTPSDVRTSTTVLCVANLTQGYAAKGFDVLIHAWSAVHRRIPGARLVIAGAGDPSPLLRAARDAACEPSVVFTGFRDTLAELYLSSGVFVCSSRSEGMSNALLEAQSYGIPAVAFDIPGNRAVVEPGHNGILVPLGNAAALAQAIVDLLTNPARRQAMGQAARARTMRDFAMDAVAERLLEVYRTILSAVPDQKCPTFHATAPWEARSCAE